jgi:hypothetical protein
VTAVVAVGRAARSTPGGFAAVETRLAAGSWTPLNVDSCAERLVVLRGALAVHLPRGSVTVAAGEEHLVPAGTPHALAAAGGPVRFRSERPVASPARYEDVLRASAPPASEDAWRDDPGLPGLAAAAYVNGIRLLGPPGTRP